MKVLFVLNSGFDTLGPSNHLLESIIEKFLLEGDRVHVIEKHTTGQEPDIPSSISMYKNLTYDICITKKTDKANFKKRYLEDIKYAIKCLRHYKKHRDVDAVFLQSCNTAFFQVFLLKLFIKKPVVFNVQDIFPLNAAMIGLLKKKSLTYKTLEFLQNCAYKMADRIITISDDMKDTIINQNIKEEKVDVIYNWSYSDEIIEINHKENIFMRENKIDNSFYKVVYAGNIGTMQNIDIILAAAKLLKDEREIRFYIIGDGVRKEKHVKYVLDNDLKNVIFFPMQAPCYAPHIYSMADVNIIPLSKGVIRTALPSKTAICLSCGKPIIACVDINSRFSKMIGACAKCSVIDCDDAEGLASCIKEYYYKNISGYSIDTRKLFKKLFLRSINVNSYVNSIKKLI